MNSIQQLNRRYRLLSSKKDAIEQELHAIRTKVRNMIGVEAGFTVYNVRATRVRAHERVGFRAVRARR